MLSVIFMCSSNNFYVYYTLFLLLLKTSFKQPQEGVVRQIADEYFKQKLKQRFPREGTAATPPHPANDFKWKDYCPRVFRKLRENFGVTTSDYMLSICGTLCAQQGLLHKQYYEPMKIVVIQSFIIFYIYLCITTTDL